MSAAAGTLIIFDCDGVLVDSERLVIDIDVAAVTAAGWPMTREQAIEAFVGRSNADVVAMIEAQVGHPLPSDWDAAWEADYRRVFDELLEPVPGVRAAVEQVMGQGRRTCVHRAEPDQAANDRGIALEPATLANVEALLRRAA